eukprot:335031-Prorocentrum_minimum.AAC.2
MPEEELVLGADGGVVVGQERAHPLGEVGGSLRPRAGVRGGARALDWTDLADVLEVECEPEDEPLVHPKVDAVQREAVAVVNQLV